MIIKDIEGVETARFKWKHEGKKRMTTCWMEHSTGISFGNCGVSRCHKLDTFNKFIGRRNSLKRMLENNSNLFNKKERTKIWEMFYEGASENG